MLLAEALVGASGEQGQTPFDHHRVVSQGHSYGNVLGLEVDFFLVFSLVFSPFLSARSRLGKQVAIADDAVLRRRVD